MSIFSCYDNDKNEWQKTIHCAKSIINSLEKQVEDYQKKADDNTGKIMFVENISKVFGQRYSNIESYKGCSFYPDTNPSSTTKRARDWTDATYNEAKLKHETNIIAIENNKAVAEKIKLFMQNVGFDSCYYTKDLKSRSRYPKSITNSAGYIEDINRWCIVEDGWQQVEKDYKRMIEDIEKYKEKIQKEEDTKKIEKELKSKEKEKELQRAALVVKYSLDYTSSWDFILDDIIDKNKYLYLAHYLLKNRENWNNGYDSAKIGLSRFDVESPKDQDIYDCIQKLIENTEFIDGRCFRDCEWNYSVLFAMVEDKDLMNDYEIANGNVE